MRTLHLLLFICLIPVSLGAQLCDYMRYRDAIFSVDTTVDIVYGNAPAIPLIYVSENVTVAKDMTLDLYMPAGDTLSQRPLMLFAFGGGFLIGSKEDEDARSVCDSFARKGYVAASINYRLNMNVSNGASAERAVWRAVQDWSAAIRYFKEYADSFRIDTNWIFAGGVSAGSISAMHLQYATDSQRPAASYSQTFPPRPDLGCKDCEGNNFKHLSTVRALINCWGAIGDTSWIDAMDSVPMSSFHGTLDPVVPFGYGFPFTALMTMPQMYGSSLISARQDHLGLQNDFVSFPGEGHNVWGTVVNNQFIPAATQYWDPILEDMRDFLWGFLQTTTGTLSGSNTVNQNDVRTYSVPFKAKHYWCWDVSGGTIVSSNLNSNQVDIRWDQQGSGQIQVQAMRHLDAEGETVSMNVSIGPLGITEKAELAWTVWPNPAHEVVHVEANGFVKKGIDWRIRNVNGLLLGQGQMTAKLSLDISHLDRGTYFLELRTKDKIKVVKLIRN